MKKQPELIILIGNIGSGKSTLAKQYQKKGYVVVSRDGVRYAIGGGKYVFKKKYESSIRDCVRVLFGNFCELGVNIVLDETSVNKQLRMFYINYAKEHGYKITGIILPKLSMEESIKRRISNPHGKFHRKTWENVWKMFDVIYSPPIKKEGFDEIIKLRKNHAEEK